MSDGGGCRHGSNMATDGVAGPATDPDTSPSQTGCLGIESTSARGGSRPRSGARRNPDPRPSPGTRHSAHHEARCGPGSGGAASGVTRASPGRHRAPLKRLGGTAGSSVWVGREPTPDDVAGARLRRGGHVAAARLKRCCSGRCEPALSRHRGVTQRDNPGPETPPAEADHGHRGELKNRGE